ncbi:tubulin domain-containing protein [Lasiosphaeris hirsuta]|uniref:Tubulin domain-containing protein n=1 Tax=Lasiosphaeris hirsuta TaxID=260670 RepID=A0AA40DS68_9PEZI|nr:tubulin domain-containing protein [Lasiosphaeris hirsuta]
MHEIITLQLGQQSNYLATHFWNTQESYFTYSENEESLVDHDVHWRPGVGADGAETFMPRTVIYDLKGGFGSLRKINALYADQDEGEGIASQALWNGPTVLHKDPPIAPSAYQQSLGVDDTPAPLTTSSVRYWSDFSRVYYHPRSAVQLSEFELGSQLMPFERHDSGEEFFAALDREHDVVDRDLRLFIEEADQMQGIQVFAGMDDAWGGFAAKYLERLRDEYGKTAIWVWGTQGGVGGLTRVGWRVGDKRMLRLANKARAITDMYKQASVVIPLALPASLPKSIVLDYTSHWHTSALLAAAIESITLPTRLKDPANQDTLSNMADTLNTMGKQNVAGLQMSFADPDKTTSPTTTSTDPRAPGGGWQITEDHLSEGLSLDLHFTPSDELNPHRRTGAPAKIPRVFSQLIASRGFPPQETADPGAEADQDLRNHRRRRPAHEPVTRIYETTLAFPLLDSFPPIFRRPSDPDTPLTATINITSSLSTNTAVSDRLKTLRTTVARSIGVEDREALGNELAEMADEYHEGWSSGTDDGEDD